jgi:hypothetical protein
MTGTLLFVRDTTCCYNYNATIPFSGISTPNLSRRSFPQWPTFALSMPTRPTSSRTIPSVKTAKKTFTNPSFIGFSCRIFSYSLSHSMISDRDGSPCLRDFSESCGPHAGDEGDHEDENARGNGNDHVRGVVLSDGASFCDFYRGNCGYFCVCYNSCSICGSMYCANSYSSGCSN